ncbi:hypothetical protein BKA70DRAFT_1319304 [Coprinopsis sp. MPI-PUGE-AT-0042]|nr:hypothetical protein BKA70DRAFT_1319304 [Coprinopsis sp. MPI-PUGE-AT-0042]
MLLPTTPFQAKLGTNYAPSDTEITTINEILIKVDTLAIQLETQMKVLKAKHAAVTSFTASHRALLSPIRRIPADILITIFQLCMESYKKCKMAASESPLLFTRVCHQWRELVIGTPSLWSGISIHFPAYPISYSTHLPLTLDATEEEEELLDVEDNADASTLWKLEECKWKEKMERRTELVKLWLERGRECPLSVCITLNDTLTANPGVKAFTDLLSPICGSASRWAHFDLVCFDPIPSSFQSLTPSQLTQLRSVSVRWKGNKSASPTFPTNSFTNASTLRHLCLDSDSFDASIVNTLTVQWVNLTELSILGPSKYSSHGITPSIALDILNKSPALARCELNLRGEPQGSLPPTGASYRVLLPHLQHLMICESSETPSSNRVFFDSLDVPSLRSLALTSLRFRAMDIGQPEEPSLLRLLRRWGDRIRHIEFGFWRALRVDHLVQALELTPNVEELTVDLTSVDTDSVPLSFFDTYHGSKPLDLPRYKNVVLKNFEVGTNGRPQPLCPNLRVARFSLVDCTEIAAKAVARIVHSRQQEATVGGAIPIESLVIRFKSLPSSKKEGKSTTAAQWCPPSRWRESKLNAPFSDKRTIRVEWRRKQQRASEYATKTRAAFESWWDSDYESQGYRSHKS